MFGVDELGLDLGTSTLHMVVRGKGIVLSEPAYVAYDRQTRNVVAVGEGLAVGVEKVNFLPGTELNVHDLHVRLGGCLDLFFH